MWVDKGKEFHNKDVKDLIELYSTENVSYPVNPQDVAKKEFADKVVGGETAIVKTRDGNYGALRNIDMRGYTLTNVLDPAEAQDVATKEYTDEMVNNVETYVDIKNAYFTKVLDHVKKVN